ncbi:hypothetical protein [Halococcus sp. IIIV-5B]|uniref:hypothetical protein n=1 Tax=Halococcus sp. IIIV-5B TaxID=2321230 RepID=UPI000E71D1FE|nr:hypothetical protein [Halococcus sp. IIIV-5B]RJT04699.1 hypothetical protein D3261_08780 [Halococcus sp. IIIV-5B]
MGAVSFYTKAFGSDVDEAFNAAVAEAERLHGQEGYTGTVAEKHGYRVIPADEHKNRDKEKYARKLMADHDDRVDDKLESAGAISLSGTQAAQKYREQNNLKGKHGSVWLFFGMARF